MLLSRAAPSAVNSRTISGSPFAAWVVATKLTAAKRAPVGECAKQSRRLPSWMPGPMVLGSVGAAIVPTSSQRVSGATAGTCWLPAGSPQTLALGSLGAGVVVLGWPLAWSSLGVV